MRRVLRRRPKKLTRRFVPAHADPTFDDDDEIECWHSACPDDGAKK